MSTYEKLLGFDFGTKRIGVAYGQTITRTAKPLTILSAEAGIPKWSSIDELIQTWRPDALIVGLPLNMDGSEQMMTFSAKDFAKQLHEHTHLPVETIDERLTTIEARAKVFEQGGFKALKKEKIDAVAAVLIVESWISQHAN